MGRRGPGRRRGGERSGSFGPFGPNRRRGTQTRKGQKKSHRSRGDSIGSHYDDFDYDAEIMRRNINSVKSYLEWVSSDDCINLASQSEYRQQQFY